MKRFTTSVIKCQILLSRQNGSVWQWGSYNRRYLYKKSYIKNLKYTTILQYVQNSNNRKYTLSISNFYSNNKYPFKTSVISRKVKTYIKISYIFGKFIVYEAKTNMEKKIMMLI